MRRGGRLTAARGVARCCCRRGRQDCWRGTRREPFTGVRSKATTLAVGEEVHGRANAPGELWGQGKARDAVGRVGQ